MLWWEEYNGHETEIVTKGKNTCDNTIYSFDIETTSYLYYNYRVYNNLEYLKFTDEMKENSLKQSCMYIWMFGVNDTVYFGRTWQDFIDFLYRIEENCDENKVVFVHNLSFEFQFLKSHFRFKEVMARKKHKVMKAVLDDFNIEFRCTYFMSNAALAELPKLFNLPVKKKVGDLDYNKIRHCKTVLTLKELGYCEYDCLVVYHYIKRELEEYKCVMNIPLTSTGHVRRELKTLTMNDYKYRYTVYKAINTNPHVYNMLCDAFAGGYTHANWIYVDEILNNLDSWDFTSSYPYVLVCEKYPMTEFKQCSIKSAEQMLDCFAYLVKVKFYNIKSKYFNNFISKNKCHYLKGAVYDNGRIVRADELEITLTDVDFKLILKQHSFDSYEIEECWYAQYKYLPKLFINFILDKYILKTQYKGVAGKELEYSKEKNKFNALYGMSVTNTIRDEVRYSNDYDWLDDRKLDNEEILDLLMKEKKKSFMSFAWGCWVTAYARRNLEENIIKLDEYVVYCDTDSIKLIQGYDKSVIDDYNNSVMSKLKVVSEKLNIDIEKYQPADKKGFKHPLGVFDSDGHYEEFITQGAKKYAYRQFENVYKFKNNKDYSFKHEHNLHITVSGVPKKGVIALKNDISNFKDDLVFDYKDTGKNMLYYCEEQQPCELTDENGVSMIVNEKSGCCIVPATYNLSKSLVYAEKVGDSSTRARFKE